MGNTKCFSLYVPVFSQEDHQVLGDTVILYSDTELWPDDDMSVCVCGGGGDCVHICFRFYSCKQGGCQTRWGLFKLRPGCSAHSDSLAVCYITHTSLSY